MNANATYNISKDPRTPVYLAECKEYDSANILDILSEISSLMGKLDLKGKNVVIKPNLVSKRSPDEAITTNPIVLDAVIMWLQRMGAESVTIAESPGGIYSVPRLRGIYAASKADKVAEHRDAILNYDLGYTETSHPEGKVCCLFDVIDPILKADVIVDLCKLKTHALTGISASVKNLFGVIPGIVKFEMHSRYPNYKDFSAMLVDLCDLVVSRCEFISVTDGIIGMEGNGPTAGTPREIGALIVSRNPFAADTVASYLIGCEGKTDMLNESVCRGFTNATHGDCNLVSIGNADIEKLAVKDFKQPDSRKHNVLEKLRTFGGGSIYRLFEPYPIVDHKACIGCGECAASCPRHTIIMKPKEDVRGASRSKAKRVPVIERNDCIKCFCCQELCPHGVIEIKKNPITRILS